MYSENQIKELISSEGQEESKENERLDNHNEMVCPRCGSTYGRWMSICEKCGTLLRLNSQMMEQKIEKKYPSYELSLKRFVNGQEMYANVTIPIDKEIICIGRSYFIMNDLFGVDKAAIDASIRHVSKYNAQLYISNGEYYLKYDDSPEHNNGRRKAHIHVNGVRLVEGSMIKLQRDDRILLGDIANNNKDGCVELCMCKIGETNALSQKQPSDWTITINRLNEKLDKLGEKLDQNHTEVIKYCQSTISRFDSVDTIIEKVQPFPLFQNKSKEDYLNYFFTTYQNKGELIAVLSDAQMQYLYKAAINEYCINNLQEESNDYAEPLVQLGKMLENFIYQNLGDFIARFCDVSEEDMKNQKHFQMGDYTKRFVKYDFNQRKVCAYKPVIRKIATEYEGKENPNPILIKEMEEAFLSCDKWRAYRNEAAHSTPKAKKKEELNYISKYEYEKRKKELFETEFPIKIKKYHDKIFGEN